MPGKGRVAANRSPAKKSTTEKSPKKTAVTKSPAKKPAAEEHTRVRTTRMGRALDMSTVPDCESAASCSNISTHMCGDCEDTALCEYCVYAPYLSLSLSVHVCVCVCVCVCVYS
jgi:hypothetical protein